MIVLESVSSISDLGPATPRAGFHKNCRQMLVFVALSVSSLILGFLLVLIAVQAHVVPLYHLSPARLKTRCYIVSIDEGRNRSMSRDHLTSLSDNKPENKSREDLSLPMLQWRYAGFKVSFLQSFRARESCVYVGVYYTNKLHVMRPGFLQLASCSRNTTAQTSKVLVFYI